MKEALGVGQRLGGCPTFDAESAVVDGELVVARDRQMPVAVTQKHSALECTVRTVCRGCFGGHQR